MEEKKISPEQMQDLKLRGFINNRGTDCFSARVITGNGRVTAAQMRALADAADMYGSGIVSFTTRLTVEIPGIPVEKTDAFEKRAEEIGFSVGGTGPLVRPVVSCKGTICKFGLIDTFALSEEIHKRFYLGWHSVKLPHKFKIAVGGCPNSCVKPDLNDIGIQGAVDPETKKHGYKIMIGGRWGKKKKQGQPMSRIFLEKEDVMTVIDNALHMFLEYGNPHERFAETIERVGFEKTEKILMKGTGMGEDPSGK